MNRTIAILLAAAMSGSAATAETVQLEGTDIRLDDGLFTLFDDRAKPMHLRSITQLRDLLQTVRAFPCVLVQQCAHDEMCGRDTGSVEEMRIPFSLT